MSAEPASERPKIVASLLNQITDRACRLLDRHGRIDAVLIEQVNIIGAKPVQEAFHPSRICSGRLPHSCRINYSTRIGFSNSISWCAPVLITVRVSLTTYTGR